MEYFQKINDYVDVGSIFQTSEYLFLSVNFGKRFTATENNTTYCFGIYNKETGEFCFCEPTNTDNPLFTSGLYNDIDGGPRFFPTKQINDSTMVMTVSAMELKNHIASEDFKKSNPKFPEKKKQLEKLANSLSKYANPVLMVVTFNK